MKPIAATAITIAALASACGNSTSSAPADPTAAFLADVTADMKAAGAPPELLQYMQDSNFREGILLGGHRICEMAAQGKSPDEIVTAFQPDPGKEQYVKNEIAAAEKYLCPQYKR